MFDHQVGQGFVEIQVGLVGLVVNCFVVRIWLVVTCFFYGQGYGFVVVFVEACSYSGEEGCSQGCGCVGGWDYDWFACDVCLDLGPEVGVGGAPMALRTSTLAPASSAISRLCLRERATPSMQARTM